MRLQTAVIRETGEKLKYDEHKWRDALVYGNRAQDMRELENISARRYRNLRRELPDAEQRLLEKNMRGVLARIRERDPQGAAVFDIKLTAQPVIPGDSFLLDLTFETREKGSPANVRTFTATKRVWSVVLPPYISDNPVWLRADLHLHSRYSDGGLDNHLYRIRDVRLTNRGYRIAYMTDHVGQNTSSPQFLHRMLCLCPPQGGAVLHPPCALTSTWQCYVINTQRVSVPTGISFFPGVELSAAHPADGEGHALGYGITTFPMTGVFDLSHGPQAVINVLNNNNALQPSSAGIAHPTNFVYNWPWLGNHLSRTESQRGIELMSGMQTAFGLTSSPVESWRGETEWLMNHVYRPIFTGGRFPALSVRTGSDLDLLNNSKFYTHILVPVTAAEWNDSARSWANRRQLVNNSLRDGRTIVSINGSWGRVTINGLQPGSIQRGLAINSALNMHLRFIPSVTGSARIRLFRRDMAEVVYEEPVFWATAGTEITRTFSRTFPGGDQNYWLSVEIQDMMGHWADVIYTTPIFLSSNP